MKRKKIILITVACLLAAGFLIWFITRNKSLANEWQFIPGNAIAIVEFQDREAFEGLMANENFRDFSAIALVGQLKENYELFREFCSPDKDLAFDFVHGAMISGAVTSSAGQPSWLFCLDLDESRRLKADEFTPVLRGISPSIASHVFEKHTIYELRYGDSLNASFSIIGRTFIFSTSTVLVETSIHQYKNASSIRNNDSFSEVYTNTTPLNGMAVFLQLPELAEYLSSIVTAEWSEKILGIGRYCSWLGLQFQPQEDGVAIDGYATARTDSAYLLLDKYTGELSAQSNAVVPASTVLLFQVNSELLSEIISENLDEENTNRDFFDHWAPWMGTHYSYGITESPDGNIQNKIFAVLQANDTALVLRKLQPLFQNDTTFYKGHRIYSIRAGHIIRAITGADFADEIWCTILEDNVLITSNQEQLRFMIDALASGQVLGADKTYRSLSEHLATNFNNSIYLNLGATKEVIRKITAPDQQQSALDALKQLADYPEIEIQFSRFNELYLVHGFVGKQKKSGRSTELLWRFEPERPVEAGPFWMHDSRSGTDYFLVQDTSHAIYCLSGGGNIIWKKTFDEMITGEINDVDFYGNGDVQMLFSTGHGIHLLDMRGDEVEGFPIRLTTGTTGPLCVLGEGESDYKMFIACANGKVYGFNKNGKPLSGWNPLKEQMLVESEMTPVTSGGDNYILFHTRSTLFIFNESGKRAGSLANEANSFSSLIAFGDSIGEINDKGNLRIFNTPLRLSRSLQIGATLFDASFLQTEVNGIPDVMYIDETGFHIRSLNDSVILDYELNDPTMCLLPKTKGQMQLPGFVSGSENKLYLFEKNQLKEGFPIPSTGRYVIAETAGSETLLLVCSDINTVYGYKLE